MPLFLTSYRPLLAALLLAAPAAGLAQTAPPRYYVGLGLYSSSFQQLGSHYGRTTVPVQVLAGYRWHPRWAVQVGAAYSGSSDDFSYSSEYLDASGTPTGTYSNSGHTTLRSVSVSLLGRRTLTRQATHRLQVDAVGGFTYQHSRYHDTGRYVSTNPTNPIDQPYNYEGQLNHLLAGLGPALRLQATPRLEVSLDLLLNTPLTRQSGSWLQSATSLGVRYNFGAGS